MTGAMNGSIASYLEKPASIKFCVTRAMSLPKLEFGKSQNPYVVTRIAETSSKSVSDPVFDGGQCPDWNESMNRELEIHYGGAENGKANPVMIVEVWNSQDGQDELIGSGSYDLTSLLRTRPDEPETIHVRLGNCPGSVCGTLSCGAPVRKAIRAAQKAGKILDVRDSLVNSVYATKSHASATAYKFFKSTYEAAVRYASKHKKTVIAGGAAVIASGAAAGGFLMMLAVPIGILALVTMPLWIVPLFVGGIITTPLWLLVAVAVVAAIGVLIACAFTLGLSSGPIRRKGTMISTKIKNSKVGRKIIYEPEKAE